MQCYRHHEANAVGICKSCNKGICQECAVDVSRGIACKNSCEQDVKDINEIIQGNKGIHKKNSASYYRIAIFYGLLSLFFISYALFTEPFLANFLIPMGLIFLLGAIFLAYSGMKFRSKERA